MPTEFRNDLKKREIVAGRLRNFIVERHLCPGSKLPGETKLAQALHTSRPTLRAGMLTLEMAGEIEIRGGSGAYVCGQRRSLRIEIAELPGPMEIVNARMTLECRIAAEAAVHGKASDFEKLRRLVEEMQKMGDIRQHRHLDKQFHLAIAEASGQQLVADIIDGLLGQWIWVRIASRIEADRAEDDRWHQAILNAIVSRNPEAASAAMRQHLLRSRDRLYGERSAVA